MNNNQINLLTIEYCSIIANAYKTILEGMAGNSFVYVFATNCDEAIPYKQNDTFQLLLFNLRLPV